MHSPVSSRILSIDILRALTMLLMIFVNDLGNVVNAPGWLEHTTKYTDGMGLADTVFPAFLIIVGMSLPFAVANRTQKGDSDALILRHIAERSFALLVMGVWLVNGEHLNSKATGMSPDLYDTLACLSFIFIWNAFPAAVNRKLVLTLKIIGWTILIILAWIYRGGDTAHRFTTSWWGILGLIGWAYLITSLIYVLGKRRLWVMVLAWLVFIAFSSMYHALWIEKEGVLANLTAPIGHGGMVALVSMGTIASMIFRNGIASGKMTSSIIRISLLALGLLILGFLANQFFIISKILATPSWVMICCGITIAMFLLVYWIADVQHWTGWAELIKGAGTNTLLCYLLPYFAYALFDLFHLWLPDVLVTGGLGLFKTFCFALLIVNCAGWLGKLNLRLKL